MKQAIHTAKAPAAIGNYSQAIQAGNVIYLSGQIPLDPVSQALVTGDIKAQLKQVFNNLAVVAEAAGGSLQQVVKLTVYLLDLSHMPSVNEIMAEYFSTPYPARTSIAVKGLPKGAEVEIDAILVI